MSDLACLGFDPVLTGERYFICYRRNDSDRIIGITRCLNELGVPMWYDAGIPIGKDWEKMISEVINDCKGMIFFATKEVFQQDSYHMRIEYNWAQKLEKEIYVVVLDSISISDINPSLGTWYERVVGSTQVLEVVDKPWNNERIASYIIKKCNFSHKKPLHFKESGVVSLIRNALEVRHKRVIIYALVFCIPCLVLIGFLWNRYYGVDDTAHVYLSYASQYDETGFYLSYEDIPIEEQNSISVYTAFSVLGFIRNFGNRSARVERIACNILDLQPIKEPELMVDGIMVDHVLKFYVLNDGWEDADNITVSCTVDSLYNELFMSCIKELTLPHDVSISAGGISLVYDLELDTTVIRHWMEENNIKDKEIQICKLYFEFPVKNNASITVYNPYDLYYFYEDDRLLLTDECGGGAEPTDYGITLFSVLDVDNPPSAVVFSAKDAFPVINDTFMINTVIAPTKSCKITCKGSYSIDGTKQETDPYLITVRVPHFTPEVSDFFYGTQSNPLINEIIENGISDSLELSRLCQKYHYQAEEYMQEIKERRGQENW